jgi:flavin-dependent dehydrogenase
LENLKRMNEYSLPKQIVHDVDLIVVGGGSAGMAAAIAAAMRGLKVTVFDASGESFDKPCGEGLMPPAVAALTALGVNIPESAPFCGVAYLAGSQGRVEALFAANQLGLGVRRRILRQAMWSRARELGVEIVDGRVTEIVETKTCVTINGRVAPWVCICTGSRDGLLKTLGLHDSRSKKNRPSRTGLRRHAKLKPWSNFVEVYWSDYCELYVTPVSPQLVNISILSWKPITFEDSLRLFPAVLTRCNGVEWDDVVAGVSPLAHHGRSRKRGRIFLAGDAAGFLDAMTGEGNSLAILSGVAVAQSIAAKNPYSYRIKWLKIVWAYWLITSVALRVSRPGWIRKASLPLVMRWPFILHGGLKMLSRLT